MIVILSMMNKVDDEDINTAANIFDKYDINGDGVLGKSEIEQYIHNARLRKEIAIRSSMDGNKNSKHSAGQYDPESGSTFGKSNIISNMLTRAFKGKNNKQDNSNIALNNTQSSSSTYGDEYNVTSYEAMKE